MQGQESETKAVFHDVRGYALGTVLTRDLFGYLFGGIILLAVIQYLFNPLESLRTQNGDGFLVSNWSALGLIIPISYPIGRLLFVVGNSLQYPFRFLKFENLFRKQFRSLESTLKLTGVYGTQVFGISVSAENAETIFGTLIPRWIFLERPDLYFLSIARANTIRLLAETTVGTLLVSGVLVLVFAETSPYWSIERLKILAIIGPILIIGFLCQWNTRSEQAQVEIMTCLTVFFLDSRPPSGYVTQQPEAEQLSAVAARLDSVASRIESVKIVFEAPESLPEDDEPKTA